MPNSASISVQLTSGKTLTLTPTSVSNGITQVLSTADKPGKAQFAPILVTLPFDPSLPEMYLLTFEGTAITKMVFTFDTSSSATGKTTPYLQVTLATAFISNVSWSWVTGVAPQIELSVVFEKIELESFLTNGGQDYESTFNLSTNSAS